jgi:hypothetical protein
VDMRNTCKILVGKPEGKGIIARPRRRWEDSAEINLRRNCYVNVVCIRSRDISVGVATRLRAGRSGFDSRQGLGIFLSAAASRLALEPTHTPMQRVP